MIICANQRQMLAQIGLDVSLVQSKEAFALQFIIYKTRSNKVAHKLIHLGVTTFFFKYDQSGSITATVNVSTLM